MLISVGKKLILVHKWPFFRGQYSVWVKFWCLLWKVGQRMCRIRKTFRFSETIWSNLQNCWKYDKSTLWRNRFLQPDNFNIEIYSMFNLWPLLLLDDFVKEILASGSTKSYLGKERAKISRLITNDLKSAAMDAIDKRIENKSLFLLFLWQNTSKESI